MLRARSVNGPFETGYQDDVYGTGADALDLIGDALIVDIGCIWCHGISFCACPSQEVHQRNIQLVTIELDADRPPREIERG